MRATICQGLSSSGQTVSAFSMGKDFFASSAMPGSARASWTLTSQTAVS